MRRRRTLELVSARPLSPSVRSLVFAVLGDEPFRYVAGQWVDLFTPTRSGLVMKRSYSIASAFGAAGPRRIELAVTRTGGPASDALHALPVGARLDMDGPEGSFTRAAAPKDRPALFVGAGTGLAPLRAMLQEELADAVEGDERPPLALLFGCRTEADILWGDELRAWERHPRFSLHVTLSRPPATWSGKRGYVQAHVGEVLADLPAALVYVCGVSAMVEDVLAALRGELGVARERIYAEEYD